MKLIKPLSASLGCRSSGQASMRVIFALAVGTALLTVALARPAMAQSPRPAPQFSVPVACQVHVDCWIVNYFDSDPGPGASDYTDGHRTYNNHRGTDFALRDLAAMNTGVAVLAAADGKVRARRDGMTDVSFREIGREAIGGRECGNGVVIDHASGWATQYCHLRKGSVRVRKGQVVKTGDVIGLIGQSGLAEFPHVHFNVFRDKNRIDPFDDGGGSHLWSAAARSQLGYQPVSIYAGGFREAVPAGDQVKQGNIQNQAVSTTSPAIVFWTGIFGVRNGDRINQTVHGPVGRVLVEREVVQEENQIRRFLWIGKKRRTATWPPGEYVGRTIVTPAEGDTSDPYTREFRITVAMPDAN